MTAIIRHRTSGERFLAELDELGSAVSLSAALQVTSATDQDTGEVDWDRFADDATEPWESPVDRWESDQFVIVHCFQS